MSDIILFTANWLARHIGRLVFVSRHQIRRCKSVSNKFLGARARGLFLAVSVTAVLTIGTAGVGQGLVHATVTQQAQIEPQFLPITATATIGKRKFDLEVAETPAQKTLGMRGRPKLPSNRGMLFVFDPPQPVAFWMKDTLHPLDLIFINDGRVQRVVRNAKTCAVEPCPFYGTVERPMQYVLEVRAGTAKSLRLRAGDPIRIDFYDERSGIKNSDGGSTI